MEEEFYNGREIFITGGSGVVGKAVIEKLLRSCNVRRIYMLIRGKRSYTAEQRLERIRGAKIFSELSKIKPDEFEKKVTAVPGDVLQPYLGITPEFAEKMANVSIILHCAATVRFDEPLKDALKLNVGGTYEALKFAKTLKKLMIFMHVSTFYSNPYLETVEPKMYAPPMDWRLCLKLIEKDSIYDMLNILSKKVITGFPNTYTFTKNIAESLVNDHMDQLPVAIYRPSIVVFSLKEPRPGFPSGLNGAMGLFIVMAVGILKTTYLSRTAHLDMTPLDIGVKCMLYYTYHAEKLYSNNRKPETIPVYLCSSADYLLKTFHELCEISEKHRIFDKVPFEKCFQMPGCTYTDNRMIYMLFVYTKQILPAVLLDLLLKLFGKKPVLMPIVRKAFNSLDVMQPFMFNSWNSSGITLQGELWSLDKESIFAFKDDFVFGCTDEGYIENTKHMLMAIREIILNEDPKTLQRAHNIYQVKTCLYNIFRLTLSYYVLRRIYYAVLDRYY